ncbi:MAG: hypothetical protein H7X79_09450 [Sporomusaceae bacterium]|nr:hypothetical protein [Sporomusaceae bacterium]
MSLGFSKLGKSILIPVLVYCILLTTGCSKSKDPFAPPPLPPLKLNAEVMVFGEKFTITNRDTFMWKDPQFIITSGGTSKFYRIATDDLEAGDRKVYSINKFVNASGEAYDNQNQPISAVFIQAKNEKGKEFGYMYYF